MAIDPPSIPHVNPIAPNGIGKLSGRPPLWRDLASSIGPPVFAATLVACLLQRTYDPLHIVLLASGLVLIGIGRLGNGGR